VELIKESKSYGDTLAVGRALGRKLSGGEVVELVGDLGSGKTALVRGLAEGINSRTRVQSPTFTLSRIYRGRNGLEIHHFDFHRLSEPGVVGQELAETLGYPKAVVAVEWSQIVRAVLPVDHLQIRIAVKDEQTRQFSLKTGGVKSRKLLEGWR